MAYYDKEDVNRLDECKDCVRDQCGFRGKMLGTCHMKILSEKDEIERYGCKKHGNKYRMLKKC